MKFFIYYRGPREQRETRFEGSCSFKEIKEKYQEFQNQLPSHRLWLVAENEYGERTKIVGGRWE